MILLLVAVNGITWEAIRRFGEHEKVAGITVICVAAVGIVLNLNRPGFRRTIAESANVALLESS
jgi:divalent metal cation (Fe/Co/Zn/Cd) transporter